MGVLLGRGARDVESPAWEVTVGDGAWTGDKADHIGVVDGDGDTSEGCDDLVVRGVAEDDQPP